MIPSALPVARNATKDADSPCFRIDVPSPTLRNVISLAMIVRSLCENPFQYGLKDQQNSSMSMISSSVQSDSITRWIGSTRGMFFMTSLPLDFICRL